MNYLYIRVEEVAADLQDKNKTPLQRAFGKHLEKVAKALHDTEWVWDSDYDKGDEEKAIKEVLGDSSAERMLEILKADALELIEQLSEFTKKSGRDD